MQSLRRLFGPGRRAKGKRPGRRPIFEGLESRDLPVVGPGKAALTPQVLRPANGRLVPIVVTGTLPVQIAGKIPTGKFRVIDEYRQFEPRGRFKLVRAEVLDLKKDVYNFNFTFTTHLKAARSSSVDDPRHYYISIAVGDSDNTQSITKAVIVP